MAELVFVDKLTWENTTLYDYVYSYDNIPLSWEEFFMLEDTKQAVKTLSDNLQGVIWPSLEYVFNALKLTPCGKISCIILGQDPYHTPDVANGLAFSSKKGAPVPKSLINIFKKLKQEGYTHSTGCLEDWAKQGVFLLNTALTVKQGEAGSHLKHWREFIHLLLNYIYTHTEKIVWILWGLKAQAFRKFAMGRNGFLIEGGHPSPVNTNGEFLKYNYFNPANEFLKSVNKPVIDWNLRL